MKQRDGLTGHLDEIAEPFNKGGWIADPTDWKAPYYKRTVKDKEVLCWEPYEQTGYYFDGVARCGLLLNDDFLLDKARKQIYGAIKLAPETDGIIRGDIPDRWPHVCFFRAFMAEYESTKNPKIIEAMKKHYDTDKSWMVTARNIFNIEQLVWLGQQTGERKYIDKAIEWHTKAKEHGIGPSPRHSDQPAAVSTGRIDQDGVCG